MLLTSVFISYRRKGGSYISGSIYRALKDEYDIFLDRESLKSGRYDIAIKNKIAECTDFILIVTKNTFDRCDEPEDWITNEVRDAIHAEKNIIPVFVGIKDFPDNVPDYLKRIKVWLTARLK